MSRILNARARLARFLTQLTIAAVVVLGSTPVVRSQELHPESSRSQQESGVQLSAIESFSFNSDDLKTAAGSTGGGAGGEVLAEANPVPLLPAETHSASAVPAPEWRSAMPQTPTLPDAKAHFPATEILEYTVQFQTGQQPVKLTPLQTAQAQGSPEPTQPPGKSDEAVPEIPEYLQNQKPHRLFLGPDIFYRNYNEEEIVPGFKSFEYGFLYGVNLEYDYVRRNSIYLGANFRYGTGQTNYRGGLQFLDSDEIIPFESKTDNQFINVEGRIGYTFKADKVGRVLVTPFIGYGYHHWNRDISGDGVIPGFGRFLVGDTEEDYSWQFFAAGLRTEYRPIRRLSVGLNFKMMKMIRGKIDINDEVTLGLGNKLHYEIEAPFTFHVIDKPSHAIDVRFTPYYRSQDIGRGEIGILETAEGAILVLEPASTTDVYGATFGVVVRF